MKRSLYVVLLLAGLALVPVSPADAAACSGSSGVTVVVQFPDRTEVRCAPGDPASGFAALHAAGFDYTIVTRFPGALCQIDAYPDSSCQNMPPTSAYWRYYRATAGGAWTASNYGAASTDPKPGSFEGWRFGDNPPAPSYRIPATPPRTPKPTSRPSARPAAHPTAAHPRGSSSNPVVGPAATPTPDAGETAAGRSARQPRATTSATTGHDSTPTAGPSGTQAAALSPVASRSTSASQRSDGSDSWIWGLALVGVLATAAGTTAVRRRRS